LALTHCQVSVTTLSAAAGLSYKLPLSVTVNYRVVSVSFSSEVRSCPVHSSLGTAACEAPSPYEPFHSSAPAPTCPEHATNTPHKHSLNSAQ